MQKRKRTFKRHLRTVVLALAATAAFAWSAIDMFGVDPMALWEFFKLSALGLLFIVIVAAVLVATIQFLRR